MYISDIQKFDFVRKFIVVIKDRNFLCSKVCRCNETLNLLSRSEYFQLETNIDNDQLVLTNLFTHPYTLTLIRSKSTIPTLTLSLVKGSVDLTSIGVGIQSGEFNAYVTLNNSYGASGGSGSGGGSGGGGGGSSMITIGPIQSSQGVINQCFPRVNIIKLEFFGLSISTSKQDVSINLSTCENTLPCNCTPLYDIMQDSSYLERIDVSETTEQLNTLHDMIIRNNKTGFQFNPSTRSQYFRVYFKKQIHIGLVQVLTPRSNVQQIRLSYFDEYNQTIHSSELQGWQINYISQFARENNALDKICPNFMFYGIQVDLLQTDPSNSPAHNATLRIHVRNCDGVGGRIPPCAETNIMYPQNLETYEFLSPECLSDMTQAYENLRGENCQEKNPEILIKFQQPNLAYISTIEIQRKYGQYPGNVRQIEAIFFDANNSIILDEITGEPIRWTSSENEPIISGDFEDVRGLILKVLKTDNDTNVQRIRVIMNGCYSAAKLATYIIPVPTTTRADVTIVSSCPNPIDLMANPSSKIISMTLNGEVISDFNSISSASSGLTAKTGDKLQTWTIVTNLIDTVTSIGLVNSPNVIGPIRYQLYDNFDAVTEVSGDYAGQIIPIYAENIEQIVITTNVPTTDNQPPKNLKLSLNGCFKEEQLRTKAQVEERISTSKSVDWCPITNILQPENMAEYYSPDALSDLSDAYENRNGVSFPLSQTPTIIAYFNAPVSITTVTLQPTYKNRTSNIIKYGLYYITWDDKPYIDPTTGKILTLTTSDGDKPLTIQHNLISNLKGLNLTILQTNGGTPTWFRLEVLGCYKPSVTYIVPIPTISPQIETTSARKICLNVTELTKFSNILFSSVAIQNQVQTLLNIPSPLIVNKLPFQIDIKFANPVNIETLGFYNGDQSKIAQIGVIADVMNDYVYSENPTFNEVSFTSTLEYVSTITVKLINTTDNSLPKNLNFEILGCFSTHLQVLTKAQVESVATTIKANIISSTIVQSAWCPETNILTRANMQEFSSPAAPFSDFSRAYENMRGENLTEKPYIINMFFNNAICVSDVLVQRTAPGQKTSNVAQIEVSYKTPENTDLTTTDGNLIVLQSPANNPTVTESQLRCNIQGIEVTILATTDQNPPSFVRLIVDGCYGPLITMLPPNNILTSTPTSSIIATERSTKTSTTGSISGAPPCTTPIEMSRSHDSYFSSIIVDGVSYIKSPYPSSFVMTKPTMQIEFDTYEPATITSVSVLNPSESQITDMTVETDYDVYSSTNRSALQVNFQPNVEFNRGLAFTLTTTMANAIFPKTIQLAIYGCGQPVSIVTKAQIESVGTTIKVNITSSTIVQSVWCPETNILTRVNMQEFSSPAAPFSDFSRAYENMRGENLTEKPYIINMFFNNAICVSDVLVQRTAPGQKTSNVAQIEVSYKTPENTDLTTADGNLIVLQSPANNPTVTESQLRCNIQGIEVTILATTDQNPPSFVRLIVDGCYGPLVTMLPPNNILTSTPTSSIIATERSTKTSTTGSISGAPPCTTPIEMSRSNESYFSSIIVDGVSHKKPPYPSSFVMTKPTMQIEFHTIEPATITSVSVVNPSESQITDMTVETDYDVYSSTNRSELQVNFQPNVEFNRGLVFTLTTTMPNAIFPKTIQLAIYGCGQPGSLVTKAQIES
ncbi:unnamed protein product, partial [Rotaria magnacalcarata]